LISQGLTSARGVHLFDFGELRRRRGCLAGGVWRHGGLGDEAGPSEPLHDAWIGARGVAGGGGRAGLGRKGVAMGGYLSNLSREINSASTAVHVLLAFGALAVGSAIAFGLCYWQKRVTLAMFPEISLMSGGEYWWRILGRARRNGSTIAWEVAITVLLVLVFFVAPRELSRWWPVLGQWRRVDLLFPFVILAMLTSPLPALLTRRQILYRLRRELLAKGVPVCLNCGCRLPSRGAARCPRCGMSVEPGMPAWPAAGGA